MPLNRAGRPRTVGTNSIGASWKPLKTRPYARSFPQPQRSPGCDNYMVAVWGVR
jgi:hypothetical protein